MMTGRHPFADALADAVPSFCAIARPSDQTLLDLAGHCYAVGSNKSGGEHSMRIARVEDSLGTAQQPEEPYSDDLDLHA